MISISDLLLGRNSQTTRNRMMQSVHAHGHTPRPLVIWSITRACDLRCIYCYPATTASPQSDELSFADGCRLLNDLAAFEVPGLIFTGGEPLVRPDTIDLMHYAHHAGLRCTLMTNGQMLNENVADHLARMSLECVTITLDGMPDRHDQINRKKGAFQTAIEAIRRCRQRGIKVAVKLIVHALNSQDLPEIFDICRREDVHRLCIYHLVDPTQGQELRNMHLSPDETRVVIEQVIELTLATHVAGYPLDVMTVGNHTDAGYVLLHLEESAPDLAERAAEQLLGDGGNRSGCNVALIDPQGDVHYDEFSEHYSLGNVRQSTFSQIWADARDERLHILRDRERFLPQRCQRCRFLDICNGNLRTRAERATGDWLAPDPGCYLHDDERSMGNGAV